MCVVAMAFRGRHTGAFQEPHLYCSRSFESRMAWHVLPHAREVVRATLEKAEQTSLLPPLDTTDARNEQVSLRVERIDTPRALIGLFSLDPSPGKLRNFNPLLRVREPARA